MRKMVGAAMAAALAVALAGCSASDAPEAPSEAPAEVTAAPSGDPVTPSAPEGEEKESAIDDSSHIDVVDAPGSLPDFEGALADAHVDSFERADGGWRAEGTVSNPSEAGVAYRIYASAMGTEGQDTRGIVQVDVTDVGPGETAAWTATFPLDDEDLQLVLRVERASSGD